MRRARAVLLAITACLVVASPAAAAKPQMERVDVDEHFLDEFLTDACGTDVFADITGHSTFRTWTDAEGNPTRDLNNFAIKVTWSSAFGSVSTVDVGADRAIYHPDGSITLTVIGNVQSITVPGQGRVYADVGRTVFHVTFPDPEGEPVFELVRQSGKHFGDQLMVICEVLGP
jgi:hypothetical protein